MDGGTVVADPKADIRFDARLLEKCTPFTEKLQTGNDQEVVDWSGKLLKHDSDCRKSQNALVDQVKKVVK